MDSQERRGLPPELRRSEDKDLLKAAFKEALSEWLDKQFATLGKWTFFGMLSMAVTIMAWVYFHLMLHKI